MALHDDWLDQLCIATAAPGHGLGARFVASNEEQAPHIRYVWSQQLGR